MSIKAGSLSTKYEVDYSDLTDAEKFYKAINDCKDYLGEAKFEEITQLLKTEKPSLENFGAMLAMLAGIEGYPVKAWYEYAFGFDNSEAEAFVSSIAWWMQGDQPYDVKAEADKKILEARAIEERIKRSKS